MTRRNSGRPLALRAGPVTLEFADGGLRYIRCGEEEVLRRIYVAVRDSHWGTVPGEISSLEYRIQDDSFRIAFGCRHQEGDIDFQWYASIYGTPDGTLRFSFDGEALSAFYKNRIGFCVLYPMSCAGRPCTLTHTNGTRWSGTFPRYIAPEQPVPNFADLAKVEHALESSGCAVLELKGDWFEMEDQRNWTDASFKIFCTPLHLPRPVLIERGQKIEQCVTLKIRPKPVPATWHRSHDGVEVQICADRSLPVPRLGLGSAYHGQPLSLREISLLKALRLDHIRVDLDLSGGTWFAQLSRAASEAALLGAGLELALFFDPANAALQIESLRRHLIQTDVSLHRVLLFPSTTSLAAIGRKYLSPLFPDLELGGGTNAYFAHLNAERPDASQLDFLSWSIHPQEHAFDDDSVIETLAAQAETVLTCRALYPGRRLVVSPITLRKRFNPYGSSPELPPLPNQLPNSVDRRQLSVFAAGWTLGSIKYLSQAGVDSVTYYETTGWRGVIERDEGSPLPDKFPSWPGQVFPLYFVFAALSGSRDRRVLESHCSDPLRVESLAIALDDRYRLLLGNVSRQQMHINITGLSGEWQVHRLDEFRAKTVIRSPERFWECPGSADGTILMEPQSIAVLDLLRPA
jgi:hypothetical protein